MYSTHVPQIMEYVESKGPKGVADVISFVLATIRTPFPRVLEQMKDIKLMGLQSKALWGFKSLGYLYTQRNKLALYESHMQSPEVLYDELLKVPGLGYAKAAFVMQCLGYDYGCLDIHNLRELGFNTNKKLKRDEYLSLMKTKSSDQWWNDWCNFIPTTRWSKDKFTDGHQVSAYHVECITV